MDSWQSVSCNGLGFLTDFMGKFSLLNLELKGRSKTIGDEEYFCFQKLSTSSMKDLKNKYILLSLNVRDHLQSPSTYIFYSEKYI